MTLLLSICQDKDGFIWIGTDYGLNKFNGIQFTHYYNSQRDSTSLLDNSVKTLMLDKEGTLWVGSVSGLQYYGAGRKTTSGILPLMRIFRYM